MNATDPTGLADLPKYTDPDVQLGYFLEAKAEQLAGNYSKYLGKPPLPGEVKAPDLPKNDPVTDWAAKTSKDLKKFNSDLTRASKDLNDKMANAAASTQKFADSVKAWADKVQAGLDQAKAAQAQTSQTPRATSAPVSQATQTTPKN